MLKAICGAGALTRADILLSNSLAHQPLDQMLHARLDPSRAQALGGASVPVLRTARLGPGEPRAASIVDRRRAYVARASYASRESPLFR